MLAEWTFGELLWGMLVLFFWVMAIWIFITIFADIFRRRDLGGGGKTLWIIFVVILPYLGVFIYLITQGQQMAERKAQDVQAYQDQFDERVRAVAGGGGGAAAEIERAKQLLDSGAITQAEFDAIKQKALT